MLDPERRAQMLADLQEMQASARGAANVLERHGWILIYADEDERARRKELKAQGITRNIRRVPFNRPKA